MNKARIFSFAAVLALSVSCGGDDDAPSPTPQAAVTSAPEATEPPPSQAPLVSSAPASQEPAAGPTAGKATPEEAAQAFYADWGELDRSSASQYATQEVIDEAFSLTRAQAEFTDCTEEADHFLCFYYYEGGGLGITVVDSDAYGYIVTDVHYVTD